MLESKGRSIIILLGVAFFFLIATMGFSKLYSQELPKDRYFWTPKSLIIDLTGDGKWTSGEGFGIDEMRLRSTLNFTENSRLVAIAESRVGTDAKWNDWDKRDNKLTQVYFQYNKRLLILPYGLFLNAKAGRVEWYPLFADPRLIIENIDLFLKPKSIYGIHLTLDLPLSPRGDLNAHIGVDSGDLSADRPKPTFNDAFIRFTPKLLKDVGFCAQIGRTQGTKFLVSDAFFHYSPTFFGNLKIDLRVGKLAGKDETPYGARITAYKPFKYIGLGGYYERRLDQPENEQIVGFFGRIISPPKLAEFMDLFMISFDTNTNTLRANIQFIKTS